MRYKDKAPYWHVLRYKEIVMPSKYDFMLGVGVILGVHGHGGHGPWNQLKKSSHGITEIFKPQPQVLFWTAPSPLHMVWLLSWYFCGILNCGSGYFSDSFACSLNSSSCLIVLSSLYMKAFAGMYCTLFCPVCLFSLGDLLFSKNKTEGEWIWGRGREV